MEPTKAQQLMIDDGLPSLLIIDQVERDKFWSDNPPRKYSVLYREEKIIMTQEQIALLFELKESKERGAASLGCSNHRLEPIAALEKLGFAKQHGYGPTSFYITEAGLEEVKKHKPPKIKPLPVIETIAKEPPKAYKEPKAKAPKKVKINPDLSPICIECGVSSKNRSAALDFLYASIGKQKPIAVVMKVVYGNDKASEGALDTVIRALKQDVESGNAKDKYEVRRVKDAKGVYSYGLYKK